jgi:hypothetical protein
LSILWAADDEFGRLSPIHSPDGCEPGRTMG